jgi:adenylate cyclase
MTPLLGEPFRRKADDWVSCDWTDTIRAGKAARRLHGSLYWHGEEPSVPVHSIERKLAAIFAADIAGYSRLMARDEVGTLTRLKACRVIIDRLIASHRGRIFNTGGDSVVADFASAVDAVQCAVAVQAAITNAGSADDEPMQFRIGVHAGDVMVDGDNLLGDGVNIAARLEALAEPGAICVSAAARDHIGNKLPMNFDDLGDQQLKNIARPIRVYRVQTEALTARSAVVVVPVLTLPDKPSVAVLPFANLSNDPDQEFFADGIAEDVMTALTRYPWVFVIARNSTFTYKGRAVDVKQVGRELGVRYVLEGSLRKSGNRIRVTAQLIEGETGNHLWAERYDRDLADIFAVQDEITEAVTIAIAPTIARAEQQRAMRKHPDSLDAWTAYQRGVRHMSYFTAADNALAKQFFQRTIDFDSHFSGGFGGLSWALFEGTIFFNSGRDDALKSAEQLAQRAVALDGADAEAHSFLGWTLEMRGDHEGALAEAERAVALGPNLAIAHGIRSAALLFSGRPREGLIAAHQSLRLDPHDPCLPVRLLHISVGHYFCCEYEEAVEAARRAIRSFPDFPSPYSWLAASLGQLGRIEEAKEALARAIAAVPGPFDTYVRNRREGMRSEDYDDMVDGLRKAGWEG